MTGNAIRAYLVNAKAQVSGTKKKMFPFESSKDKKSNKIKQSTQSHNFDRNAFLSVWWTASQIVMSDQCLDRHHSSQFGRGKTSNWKDNFFQCESSGIANQGKISWTNWHKLHTWIIFVFQSGERERNQARIWPIWWKHCVRVQIILNQRVVLINELCSETTKKCHKFLQLFPDCVFLTHNVQRCHKRHVFGKKKKNWQQLFSRNRTWM